MNILPGGRAEPVIGSRMILIFSVVSVVSVVQEFKAKR